MNNLPETPSLSLQSAADQYGVCVRTIRRRIASGELPAFRIGRAIRVRPSDVASLGPPDRRCCMTHTRKDGHAAEQQALHGAGLPVPCAVPRPRPQASKGISAHRPDDERPPERGHPKVARNEEARHKAGPLPKPTTTTRLNTPSLQPQSAVAGMTSTAFVSSTSTGLFGSRPHRPPPHS